MRPVIWRLQEPPPRVEYTRDYGSLPRLGRVITILSHSECPSVNSVACEVKMKEALTQFRPGDYILWCGGDPMTAFLAGKVLAQLGINDARWLRWDREVGEGGRRMRSGTYVPVPA
jgi:hypothetical protein